MACASWYYLLSCVLTLPCFFFLLLALLMKVHGVFEFAFAKVRSALIIHRQSQRALDVMVRCVNEWAKLDVVVDCPLTDNGARETFIDAQNHLILCSALQTKMRNRAVEQAMGLDSVDVWRKVQEMQTRIPFGALMGYGEQEEESDEDEDGTGGGGGGGGDNNEASRDSGGGGGGGGDGQQQPGVSSGKPRRLAPIGSREEEDVLSGVNKKKEGEGGGARMTLKVFRTVCSPKRSF